MNFDELHNFLEEQVNKYNRPDFIPLDPISIPHQFSKKQDIEIAGFLAATMAWGQRLTILRNANELIRRMDYAPYEFILNHGKKDLKQFENFKHRTFNGIDCVFFIATLKYIYKKHTSLEEVFNGGDAKTAITNFRNVFFSISHPQRTKKHLSNPESGSACKRMNMFLRWMVRKDSKGVDFGIWGNNNNKTLSPAQLMCPLDIHSGNVARKLGLLKRNFNDWQAVEELTNKLRKLDPKDPAKYDFALFGIGVSKSLK